MAVPEHWYADATDEVVALRAEVERLRAAVEGLQAAADSDRLRIERLRAAAKRVLEADMRGARDLDALNELEDAAGFSQQGGA